MSIQNNLPTAGHGSDDIPTDPLKSRLTPAGANQPPAEKRPSGKARRRNSRRGCLPLVLAAMFAVLWAMSIAIGALAGYSQAGSERVLAANEMAAVSLQQQYDLALQDQAEGRYDVARQRLEYVLSQDPGFPGVTEHLAQVAAILYATATPTPPLPPATATATPDLRPVQDLFESARAHLAAGRWTETIDTLLALRQADAAYQTARVDGMLFMALRQRGVDKIWKEGNLQGGTYDLALAVRFGPLDMQANTARDLARLYLTGSSFFEVYPEEAVVYFAQVAAAAPGLHDASGVTAAERYWESLVQYGDKLMGQKQPCEAQTQYQTAYAQRATAELEERLRNAINACTPPTATIGPSATATATATSEVLPTATWPGDPTATSTLPAPPTAPVPPTETVPVPPTETQPAPPTETQAPPPTETPAPPTEPPPPTEVLPATATDSIAPPAAETPAPAATDSAPGAYP